MGGARHPVRVQQVAEQLDPFDEARAGAREVRRRVDREHTRAEPREPLALLHRLGGGLLGVVAAGHRHDHLGAAGLELVPAGRARPLTRQAEHVLAAGELDHLWHPVPADIERVEPLERRHPRARRTLDCALHGLDPLGRVEGQPLAGVVGIRGRGEPRHVGEHLAERGGVERDHLRLGRQPLRHGAHVVEGDGAHLAHRLRDDQVHVQLLERVLVQLVERLAAARSLAHRGVYLGRLEPGWDHAAREVGELFGSGRVVTLMGDRGHAVAEPEGEQHLGRGWNQ